MFSTAATESCRALQMLTVAEKSLRKSGIALWLTALNPEPLELIQKSALGHTLGRARMYFNLEEAVKSFQAQAEPPHELQAMSGR